MAKQSFIYLILSILAVIFASYLHQIIGYIDWLFTFLSYQLAPIFSQSSTGVLIRELVVLVLLPVACAAVPALLYRAIKGKNMPYFYEITWLLWLIVLLSNILIH